MQAFLTCKLRNMYHSQKTVYVYLKPFSFSVSIRITKYCSYMHSKELILTVFIFSVLQKNIFHRWSCVTYQKNRPTRGDIIKAAPTGAIYNRSMVRKHPVEIGIKLLLANNKIIFTFTLLLPDINHHISVISCTS